MAAGASRKTAVKQDREAGQRFEVLCSPSPALSTRESPKVVPSTLEAVEFGAV